MLNSGTAHPRDKLAGILWPDSSEANARANLRRALYQLRRALETAGATRDYLLSDDLSVAFDRSAAYRLDTATLEQKLDERAAPEAFIQAVAAYAGELLPGYYDDWVVLERERLQAVFERKMQALLDRLGAAQRWPDVLEWAGRWIATGQVPEPAYRSLMLAHAALGDAASMAAAFKRCADALRRELGVEPSELTQSLYTQLARGEHPAQAAAAGGERAAPARSAAPATPGPATPGPATPGPATPAPAGPRVAVAAAPLLPAAEWLRTGLSPLVGRDRELARAKALWQQAQDGAGQVLLISGEPGIGKSRLTRELIGWVAAAGGRVLVGECHAEGSAPYAPVAQILSQIFAGDGLAVARRLGLPDLVLADLVKLAPHLQARLPGLPPNPALDPQSEQFRLYESVVQACLAVGQETPTLCVVEDVHWADSGTLGVLRHLARRSRPGLPGGGLPLLLALTYRDSEVALEAAQGPAQILSDLIAERRTEQIRLRRLSPDQTRELVAGWFGKDIPAELVDGIYRQTEGNPFFAEEICKSLTAEGDPDRPARAVAALEIPHSVRAAVLARVERLSEGVQEALRWAALLGREFDSDTLRAAAGLDEEALIEALESAERARLVSNGVQGTGCSRRPVPCTLYPAPQCEAFQPLSAEPRCPYRSRGYRLTPQTQWCRRPGGPRRW
jgi:DNA-binding SARP family transcriptional activator